MKGIQVLAVVGAAAVALAGCGGGSGSSAPVPQASPMAAATPYSGPATLASFNWAKVC